MAAAVARRSLSVLVVEDNPDILRSLSAILTHEGHAVRGAADAVEGLRLFKAEVPKAVLLDIGLPGMSGWDLAQQMRVWQGPARRPVLVAVTGYGGAEAERRSAESGIDRHLVKPVDPDDLLALLDRLCG
jgi:CheY-like chemotaxis protein